jgi:hypothetical protein
MGSWDVMSSHYIDRKSPPPGTSSFTRIRLGWISAEQVLYVRPGKDRSAFLPPLAKGGESVVVKIPLKRGRYYLVENRQPIGFDRGQPDSGILILRVDPRVREGSGTVRIMDADPNSANFSHATFRPDRDNRKVFIDKDNNVAIIPLWSQGENQGVLVTSPHKSKDALQATQMIQKLYHRFPDSRDGKAKQLIEDCVAAFKQFDFQRSYQIGQKAMDE